MTRHIHLVSFNNPYPADYGGVIDVFYKIKALHEANISITLHVFEYGRERQTILEQLCTKVIYYPRPRSLQYHLSTLPFIVNTRKSKSLLTNLLVDNDPILFEGLHCTAWLNHSALQNRVKVVRTHNIEYQYYKLLAIREEGIAYRAFLLIEALKLRLFEKTLRHANALAAISASDAEYFKKINQNTAQVGAFHPYSEVKTQTGIGNYMLFHGNLEVAENLEAVNFILNYVMSEFSVPLIIAGKNPPLWLQEKVDILPHITLVSNPSNEEMEELISQAHILLLPTFQSTGLKLKLLYSLFAGRHVIVTPDMVKGSGLEDLCHICKLPTEIQKKITELMNIPFDERMLSDRKNAFQLKYSNKENTKQLLTLLFPNN